MSYLLNKNMTNEINRGQEIEQMIATADGYKLWSFIGKLRNSIGNGVANNGRYIRLCSERAKELNKGRYGNWHEAIVEANHMEEPTGIFKTDNLLPVMGYPCSYMVGKDNNYLVLTNPKTNSVYMRQFGVTNVDFKTAKKIFSS